MYKKFLELLEKHGLSVYQVSKDTGIPESTFSMWKKRGTPLTFPNMQKLADYFSVPLDFFTEGGGNGES